MCPELGGRPALKRAHSRFYGLYLLLFVGIVAFCSLNAQAQSRARSPKSMRPQDVLQSLRSVGPRPPHVFYPPNMPKLPDWVRRHDGREMDAPLAIRTSSGKPFCLPKPILTCLSPMCRLPLPTNILSGPPMRNISTSIAIETAVPTPRRMLPTPTTSSACFPTEPV